MKLALSLVALAGLATVSIGEPPAKPAPAATPATKTTAATPTGKPVEIKAPTQEEMMAAWAEMNKPGAEHAELAKTIGDWDMTIKSINPMDPTQTSTDKGTEKVEWLIEGRYVKCTTVGQMGGGNFVGFGINGYNTVTKKFETTWIDNMSTGQMAYVGTMDANHNLSMDCQYDDPMTGTKKISRMVCTWTDANTRGFKMYEVDGSKETLMMEATYTRKATATGTAKPVETTKTVETKKTTK